MRPLLAHTSSLGKFSDRNELKRFVRNFVKERMDSLQKDVIHCLQVPYAPFPAILYCLSSVDFLGALVAGQAAQYDSVTKRLVRPTPNTLRYMRDFMCYTQEQSTLILGIFRHKLVHLAQPSPCAKNNGKNVAWRYEHQSTQKHLLLENAPKDTKIQVKSDWEIPVDSIFTLGIKQFIDDIQDSVYRHGGYLDLLENDSHLQDMFKKAIEELFQS
jgi:hypothetical protein